MAQDKDKYVLQSVETSLLILDLFIENDELSAAEVARLLDMNRSKAFRFLVTLEKSGYITKKNNLKYRLSAKVATLGSLAQDRQELINLIHPHLSNITDLTGESTLMSVLKDSIHSTFVDKCVGSRWLTLDIAIGHTQFAHASASGKCLLAFSTDQFINQYIQTVTFVQYTESSIKDAQELLRELDEIRENGYASDKEQIDIGLTCYAVPIIVTDATVAAISISGPTTRMLRNKEKHIELLSAARKKIEKALS